MITPSGRFQVNTRLCLSISDFHPDTWNPSWTVSTIIMGLISFMNGKINQFYNSFYKFLESSPTLGSLSTTDEEKRVLARRSLNFNLRDKEFVEIFPELTKSLREEAEDKRNKAENAQELSSKTNM